MTSTAGGGGVIPKVDEVKEAVRNFYCLSVPKVDGGGGRYKHLEISQTSNLDLVVSSGEDYFCSDVISIVI